MCCYAASLCPASRGERSLYFYMLLICYVPACCCGYVWADPLMAAMLFHLIFVFLALCYVMLRCVMSGIIIEWAG